MGTVFSAREGSPVWAWDEKLSASNENNVLKLGGEFHNLRLAEAGTGSNALGNHNGGNNS